MLVLSSLELAITVRQSLCCLGHGTDQMSCGVFSSPEQRLQLPPSNTQERATEWSGKASKGQPWVWWLKSSQMCKNNNALWRGASHLLHLRAKPAGSCPDPGFAPHDCWVTSQLPPHLQTVHLSLSGGPGMGSWRGPCTTAMTSAILDTAFEVPQLALLRKFLRSCDCKSLYSFPRPLLSGEFQDLPRALCIVCSL